MKFGAAVVAGALVMFASGYMLGYTTAVPDMLRATSLDLGDLDKIPSDEEMESMMQGEFEVPLMDDPAAAGAPDEQMAAAEMDHLKRMIVPLLTDEEIKRIREEVAKAGQVEVQPDAPVVPEPEAGQAP